VSLIISFAGKSVSVNGRGMLILLLACTGPAKNESSTESANDSTSDSPVDSPADSTPLCESMSSGTDWAWNGECPQMRTPCDIVVTGCSFSIDYEADGGMTMGMPKSGTIADTTVTFGEEGAVKGCTGTLIDADHIEGSCSDGCTFELTNGR
jgi:hypothetical protein